MTRILRLPDVIKITGLSRSSIYNYIDLGLFPKPIKLGKRAVGWPANEISSVNKARIEGKNNDKIYDVVKHLEEQRHSK